MAGDLNVLVWITEGGWECCVDAAAAVDPREVTLLHVAPGPEQHALLGRRHRADLAQRVEAVAAEAAEALLEDAEERLGRHARRVVTSGRPETIVMQAASTADLLVLAREGDRPGPRSIGHAARYIVDHAPCAVLLAWPAGGPHGQAPPPPPGHPGPHGQHPPPPPPPPPHEEHPR